MNALLVLHPHYPSPCTTTLAPLAEGEVLSPEKIRATTGGIASPPSLACTNPPEPALSFEKHYILASLVKGRWIDGKAQTVALLHFYLRYIRLFYSPNFLPSRRRDCYTTFRSPPHACHMNALLVSHPCETLGVQLRASMPPLSKVRCCRPKKSGDYRRDCRTTIPRPSPTLPKPHYPTHFS